MNAEDILNEPYNSEKDGVKYIRLIAAQIASLNEKLNIVLNPPLMYDTSNIDPADWPDLPQSVQFTVREPRATLRDQFAMAALTGLLSDPTSSGPEGCATAAYLYADAMMERRK